MRLQPDECNSAKVFHRLRKEIFSSKSRKMVLHSRRRKASPRLRVRTILIDVALRSFPFDVAKRTSTQKYKTFPRSCEEKTLLDVRRDGLSSTRRNCLFLEVTKRRHPVLFVKYYGHKPEAICQSCSKSFQTVKSENTFLQFDVGSCLTNFQLKRHTFLVGGFQTFHFLVLT